MVKRVFFGEVGNEKVAALGDVNRREFVILASLAVMVLGLGLWPAPLTELMDATVQNLVEHISHSKLPEQLAAGGL